MAYDALPHDARVATILDELAKALGVVVPKPVATFTTNWSADVDARGAYSYWPVGARDDDVFTLSQPVNNALFFAGEATNVEYQGSVAGAVLSGARAAAQVLDARNPEAETDSDDGDAPPLCS